MMRYYLSSVIKHNANIFELANLFKVISDELRYGEKLKLEQNRKFTDFKLEIKEEEFETRVVLSFIS